MFFALLTLFDGGIELAVGWHALNNLWIALVANTPVTVLPSPSLFVVPVEEFTLFPDVISEIVVFALAFAIFNRKYQWFRWRSLVASGS